MNTGSENPRTLRAYFPFFAVQEAFQLIGARRVAQFAQCFGFDLADALARNVKLFAHFFQRVVGVHINAKAHPQHFCFARGQAFQYAGGYFAQAGIHGRIGGGNVVYVFNEVAQMAVVVIANRCFHGNGH